MTLNSLEVSEFSSNPVECYEFNCGPIFGRYTSADEDIHINGNVFISTQIKRTEAQQTNEISKSSITVTVPRTCEVAQILLGYPPTGVILLKVYGVQRITGDYGVVWLGRVLNASCNGVSSDLTCESIYTSVRRVALSRMYQTNCPLVLYDPNSCRVSKTTHQVSDTVTAVSGLTVSVERTYANNYFAGGIFEWNASGGVQRRCILSNSGRNLGINFPIPLSDLIAGATLPAGTQVSIYPGCAHTLTDCRNKFNNIDNYGGFPYIPIVNPFNGTTLY